MTDEQRSILEQVAVTGNVAPDTFKGRGFVVSGLVRRGLLDWERGMRPRYDRATALVITEAGRAWLRAAVGEVKVP